MVTHVQRLDMVKGVNPMTNTWIYEHGSVESSNGEAAHMVGWGIVRP